MYEREEHIQEEPYRTTSLYRAAYLVTCGVYMPQAVCVDENTVKFVFPRDRRIRGLMDSYNANRARVDPDKYVECLKRVKLAMFAALGRTVGE